MTGAYSGWNAWQAPDVDTFDMPFYPTERMQFRNLDAAPFREVINALRKAHAVREIAEATGVSRYELTRISVGQVRSIRPTTAMKLRSGLLSMLPEESQ